MDPVSLTRQLIDVDSVTSATNLAITEHLGGLLEELDFEVSTTSYIDLHGTQKVNLAARRLPVNGRSESGKTGGGGIGFFSHTDVVSTDGWNCPHGGPLDAAVAEGRLWGRGACDMKGPMAATLAAIASVAQTDQYAPIYFFATGDEECGMSGAQLLAEHPFFKQLAADRGVGLITEPTELQLVNAHKGGCHLNVFSHGTAAHSSTAEGRNANWDLIPFLSYLHDVRLRCASEPALRNEKFAPADLALNIVVENQPRAANITVGQAVCRVFFRPMPDTSWRELADEMQQRAIELGLDAHAYPPLPPLHTADLRPFVRSSLELLGQEQPQCVSFATDGCCLTELQDLVVLGPGSIAQAHRVDEWIAIDQLLQGVEVYSKFLRRFAQS